MARLFDVVLYLRDMLTALWAWVTVWCTPIDVLERRKKFIDDIIDDKRKKQIPLKILYLAYKKRGVH